MILTPFGQIAQNQWLAIPQRFPHILLDELIIMPNHIHGILQIVRAPLTGAPIPNDGLIPNTLIPNALKFPNNTLNNDIQNHNHDQSSEKYLSDYQLNGCDVGDGCDVRVGATARVAPTIGYVIGAYKSLCVHECLKWAKTHDVRYRIGPLWQRNYYEHVIRNEKALFKIREYIRNNPLKWEKDRLRGVGKNRF